jgi:5-methylcytosine-specific restriction endonuclease McrA
LAGSFAAGKTPFVFEQGGHMATKDSETPEDRIKRIKRLYNNRKYNKDPNRKIKRLSFSEFFEWYEKQEKKCCYCGITEPELAELIDSERLTSKRLPTRGRHLEFERKDPKVSYDKVDNLALSCYWCNNAKTDTFTADEFKKVGNVFRQIWQARLDDNGPNPRKA